MQCIARIILEIITDSTALVFAYHLNIGWKISMKYGKTGPFGMLLVIIALLISIFYV